MKTAREKDIDETASPARAQRAATGERSASRSGTKDAKAARAAAGTTAEPKKAPPRRAAAGAAAKAGAKKAPSRRAAAGTTAEPKKAPPRRAAAGAAAKAGAKKAPPRVGSGAATSANPAPSGAAARKAPGRSGKPVSAGGFAGRAAKTPRRPGRATATAGARKPRAARPQRKASTTGAGTPAPADTASVSVISSAGVTFTPYQPVDGEPYMSPRQREHFIGILNAWRDQLVKKFEGVVAHLQNDANVLPDIADRASREEGFSMELYTHSRESRLMNKIDHTLDNIDNGVYGYCEECGIEIGIRRLEARPTAALCIDCKQVAEIKEQHFKT